MINHRTYFVHALEFVQYGNNPLQFTGSAIEEKFTDFSGQRVNGLHRPVSGSLDDADRA